jgi:MFS family permease
MSIKLKVDAMLIATMAVLFVSAGVNAINPALQRIIQAFPDVPVSTVRLISTLPSLAGMVLGLVIGATVGKYITFRFVFIIGMITFIIGGTGPAVFNFNIRIILFFRAFLGIAVACLTTRNAFILSTVKDPILQARMIGSGQVSSNIGAACLQMICGFLADIRWNLAFYPYLIGIVPLIILLMLREKEVLTGRTSDGGKEVKKEKIKKWAFVYLIIQFLTMLNAFPVIMGMSTIITHRNLGTASTTAMILAVCQIGGVITGSIFGIYYKVFKRLALPLSLFVQGIGVFFILIFKTAFLIGFGAVLSGIGTILIMLLCTTYAGQSTPKVTVPLMLALFNVFGQISSFGSVYYVEFANRLFSRFYEIDIERVFILGSIVFGAMVIISLLFNFGPRPPTQANLADLVPAER